MFERYVKVKSLLANTLDGNDLGLLDEYSNSIIFTVGYPTRYTFLVGKFISSAKSNSVYRPFRFLLERVLDNTEDRLWNGKLIWDHRKSKLVYSVNPKRFQVYLLGYYFIVNKN